MVGSGRHNNSSVYIGDLVEAVTERLLHQVFGQAGTIVSVRLCRDSVTRKPLGYAYVNYASPADADRALETLNHVELCGRQVRLMPSQRDPSSRRSGVGNIFAKNLDPDRVTNRVLYQTFEAFGKVLSAKVATDARGRSRGYGFVQFEDPECAKQAIDGLNGTELCGQCLFVGPFIPAKDRALEPGKFCNVYVRNLGSEVTEATLADAFGEFGPISSTVVMRNAAGKSRGFGFVNFEQAADAANAVANMDGHRHQGLRWRVDRAQKRNDPAEQASRSQAKPVRGRLYLRNLGPSSTEADLYALFEEYGTVDSVRVVRDGAGKSKGIGYVHFADPEDAEAAITGMNGKIVGDSQKPLFVTLAQRTQSARADQPPAPPAAPQPGILHPHQPVSMPVAQIPVPGLMVPNTAFFQPSAPFYFGPMAVQPSPPVVPNPYYLPMGSRAMFSELARDHSGSMAAMPGSVFSGAGLTPLQQPGSFHGPGESSASGAAATQQRRQRRPRLRQQGASQQQSLAEEQSGSVENLRQTSSPFSALQMQAALPNDPELAESSASAQRRALTERIADLAGSKAPIVAQAILQQLTSAEIGELLTDEDALVQEVEAQMSISESQEPPPASPC